MLGKANSCLRNREKPDIIKPNLYKPKKDKLPYRGKKSK